MKQSFILLLLLIVIISGCTKSSVYKSSSTPPEPEPKAVALFSINNASNNSVLEARVLEINNLSQNAVSYHWGFWRRNDLYSKITYFLFPDAW